MQEVKIKGIVVEYEKRAFVCEERVTLAVLANVHAAMVRKAWTPIVTALQAIGEVEDDFGELISLWASRYALGDRSRKLRALAEKKAKLHVEEKLKEGRYSVVAARASGLVAASVEEIFARDEASDFFAKALAELSPEDLLEPLAVTMEEVTELREEVDG